MKNSSKNRSMFSEMQGEIGAMISSCVGELGLLLEFSWVKFGVV